MKYSSNEGNFLTRHEIQIHLPKYKQNSMKLIRFDMRHSKSSRVLLQLSDFIRQRNVTFSIPSTFRDLR